MSAPSYQAFVQLADDVTWFMQAPEVRVMHVATTGTERPMALHQLTLSEGHPFNHSPFFVLEDAHLAIDGGWIARAERMAVIHEARRGLLAEEGIALAPLAPLVHGASEAATFGRRLEECLAAQRGASVLQGIVVVLAPGAVEEGELLAASIAALAKEKALEEVRFIVLEIGDEIGEALEPALGESLLRSRCEVDPEVRLREHVEAMRAAANAPEGAAPEQLAGGAAPKGVVPPDTKESAEALAAMDPETVKKMLGDAAPLMGAAGIALRQDVLGAAVAMQEGETGRAIELQEKAAKASRGMGDGMARLSCVLEVILGTYQSQGKKTREAKRTLEGVAARAEEAELYDVAALAWTGLGAGEVGSDAREAARLYVRAGELAEKAKEPILAIESYRMAGQLAARTRAEGAAEAAWKRALGVASVAPPEVAALSSAPMAARMLAKVLMGHGSHAAAAALLDQADEMERAAPEAEEPAPETAPPPHTEQPPSTQDLPEIV